MPAPASLVGMSVIGIGAAQDSLKDNDTFG
jgi:hypothetical protein